MSDQLDGSDFLTLDATGVGTRDRASWLTDQIRQAVFQGVLRNGARLPATRSLASDLGFSRGTVVSSYQRLVDEGLLTSRVGAGTVVVGAAVTAADDARRVGPPDAVATQRWRVSSPSPIRLDLTPGLPNLSDFPRAAWLRAERETLRLTPSSAFGYPDPRGDPDLRSALAEWLTRSRGVDAHPDDVIVTSGVAQGLALLAETLRRRGACSVVVEDPGSRGLHDHVRHWGLTPLPIPVDDDGLTVDALTDEPAVLVTPAHQFPTGVVLAPDRRSALLTWAHRSGGLIIEDDYDAEHRYDRTPAPAMQALAPEQVAYVGSVSKTLAPALRLGWLLPPRTMHTDLVIHKDSCDRGAPVISQQVLARLIGTGVLDRHLRKVRLRQRRRRDALVAGLGCVPHPGVVRGVAAGLHLLLTLPDGFDDRDVASALAEQVGVRVDPLSVHRLLPGAPGLVIGYAATPASQLESAGRDIARLLAAW